MAKNKEFQQIQDIGFKSMIDKFKDYTGSKRSKVVKGIGDDASVVRETDGNLTCTTSEIFLEGVHFDLTYTPFTHLGYKIVTAAVSDIYAMNAEPLQILIDVAVPNKYSVQMIEELYKGIDAAAKDYNVQVTGGDTTASHQLLAISVTATGSAAEKDIIFRAGAKQGDIICVTGELGSAIAGLRILLREKKAWQENPEQQFQPDLQAYEHVVQRQLLPKARIDLYQALGESDIKPNCMIDLTQGLVADLTEVLRQSGVGAEIYSPAVPISLEARNVADEMNEDVDKYAFYGGEDFEMLFTLPEPLVEKFKAEFDDFIVIGRISDKDKQLTVNTGEEHNYQIDLN
ncbi:thiamine-phosphate kinase [Rhodohalobacter halophilus]|uniref:thiamine-phosphate kinase n=1 Tax=Rhodohalobacter halophilus TaxID=1812810 RepID=UPI00083F8B23|nr:thiamine-phosphate kinase [Rhodohalobacter halophilus]